SPTDHLFDQKAGEAADWFAKKVDQSEDKSYAVWLDGASTPAPTEPPLWLVFRGAFLLEQYETQDGKDVPNLQWPLVTHCKYSSSEAAVYSVLGITRKPKPQFYLNLHLPLPVRRTSLQGNGAINVAAFPFSAVYDLVPRKAERDQLLRIDTLVAGWTRNDGVP